MRQGWKKGAFAVGGLSMAFGLLLLFLSCLGVALLIGGSSGDALGFGMFFFPSSLLAWGGGGLLFYHARRSLAGKASAPLRLPPLWLLAGGFVLVLVALLTSGGSPMEGGEILVILPLVALLPPLLAIAWVLGRSTGGLTWRQFSLLCLLGATVSVFLAILLEVVLPALILALVSGLFDLARSSWERLVEALAGGDVAEALTSYAFLVAWVQFAVVAPLAEELTKSVVVLPWIRGRTGPPMRPQQVFLLGAVAGAGFAALENLLYIGFGCGGLGVSYGGGVALLRSLGAAVHPLGTGLVALGWYYLSHPEEQRSGVPSVWQSHPWLSRYGLAVGIHALWNGGGLLVVALVGANFFGTAPGVDVLGLTLSGVLLALLALLGVGAGLGLRAFYLRLVESPDDPDRPPEQVFLPGRDVAGRLVDTTDRAMAIWAVLCLIVALSIGLGALRLLGGG